MTEIVNSLFQMISKYEVPPYWEPELNKGSTKISVYFVLMYNATCPIMPHAQVLYIVMIKYF